MLFNPDRLHYLFLRYTGKDATLAEVEEFFACLADPHHRKFIEGLVDDQYGRLQQPADETGMDWEDMFTRIRQASGQDKTLHIAAKGNYFIRRWVAVAAALLVIGFGSYFLFFNKENEHKPLVTTELPGDVKPPATNRAMITLADGRPLYLDTAANGELVQQGSIKVVKLANGQIVYQTSAESTSFPLTLHTLTNPRGSKVIDIQLSDGSHVWLNAGSSVTYPVAFVGDKRKVTVSGEAYFEVNPYPLSGGKKMPFIVSKGDLEVEVLGTHFNVNAYDEEPKIKITLLEGSVKVKPGATAEAFIILKPGQQAQADASGQLSLARNVDVEKVMAWKNNEFIFQDDDLPSIMRQLSRWYNIEVAGADKDEAQYTGRISNNVPLSQVLAMFEKLGYIQFVVNGNKVTVSTNKKSQ